MGGLPSAVRGITEQRQGWGPSRDMGEFACSSPLVPSCRLLDSIPVERPT